MCKQRLQRKKLSKARLNRCLINTTLRMSNNKVCEGRPSVKVLDVEKILGTAMEITILLSMKRFVNVDPTNPHDVGRRIDEEPLRFNFYKIHEKIMKKVKKWPSLENRPGPYKWLGFAHFLSTFSSVQKEKCHFWPCFWAIFCTAPWPPGNRFFWHFEEKLWTAHDFTTTHLRCLRCF